MTHNHLSDMTITQLIELRTKLLNVSYEADDFLITAIDKDLCSRFGLSPQEESDYWAVYSSVRTDKEKSDISSLDPTFTSDMKDDTIALGLNQAINELTAAIKKIIHIKPIHMVDTHDGSHELIFDPTRYDLDEAMSLLVALKEQKAELEGFTK